MKLQMSKEEYTEDQKPAGSNQKISIGDPDKLDTFKIDPFDFGQLASTAKITKNTTTGDLTSHPAEKAPVKKVKSVIEVDPKTGKKIYKGPKLKSRRIVKGKEWDENHPNFHDRGVGGI